MLALGNPYLKIKQLLNILLMSFTIEQCLRLDVMQQSFEISKAEKQISDEEKKEKKRTTKRTFFDKRWRLSFSGEKLKNISVSCLLVFLRFFDFLSKKFSKKSHGFLVINLFLFALLYSRKFLDVTQRSKICSALFSSAKPFY